MKIGNLVKVPENIGKLPWLGPLGTVVGQIGVILDIQDESRVQVMFAGKILWVWDNSLEVVCK